MSDLLHRIPRLPGLGYAIFCLALLAASAAPAAKAAGDTGPGLAELVRDINPATQDSSPTTLATVGATVYFTPLNGYYPQGLWRSDGTQGGTMRLLALSSGELDPIKLLGSQNGIELFSLNIGDGLELWRSDGTPAGTHLVDDTNPGWLGVHPGPAILSGNHLFFAASTSATDRELWAIRTRSGVDGSIWTPDTSFAAPGATATIPIRYTNRGTQTASGLTLSVTLDPALQYIGDDTGVTPSQAGSSLTWHLPSAGFLDSRFIHVRVSTPAAALGMRYPVAVALSSAETDADPSNNAASTQVQLARQTFAPLLAR